MAVAAAGQTEVALSYEELGAAVGRHRSGGGHGVRRWYRSAGADAPIPA